MAGFSSGHFAMKQHKEIHDGLVMLEKYLKQCQAGVRQLRKAEVRKLTENVGSVLWQHLDEEVKKLGAENMKRYWTLEELSNLPF